MASLDELSKSLIKACYPKQFMVEDADHTFAKQKSTFHSNETLLLDALKNVNFNTIKRMVRSDVLTFFYRDCHCTDLSEAFPYISKRKWVVQNWPHDLPLPPQLGKLTGLKQAVRILMGIWSGHIRLTKATPEERKLNAVVAMDNGEYHCVYTTRGATVTPQPAVAPAENLAEPAAKHASEPSREKRKKSGKRKRSSKTEDEEAAPKVEARTTPPPAVKNEEVIDLCTPPRKKQRRNIKREESPEIQCLTEAPPKTPRRARATSVAPQMSRRAPTPGPSRAKTPGAERSGGQRVLDVLADDPVMREHRKKKLMKLAVCHTFEKFCADAIPYNPRREPEKWTQEMMKYAEAIF